MTLTEDELARLAELEDLLTVGLVEQPINGSVLSWGEAALIAHRIGRHLLRATPVADTAGIDAAKELRMALREAVTNLPQPTLGKAGGVNRGAVIDAIEQVYAAALRTPKPEGDR